MTFSGLIPLYLATFKVNRLTCHTLKLSVCSEIKLSSTQLNGQTFKTLVFTVTKEGMVSQSNCSDTVL